MKIMKRILKWPKISRDNILKQWVSSKGWGYDSKIVELAKKYAHVAAKDENILEIHS